VIYQHPLAYLIGMEGLALLRAWAGDYDYDEQFVRARLAEVRRLLDDEALSTHAGVLVGRDATSTAYRQWSGSYDDPGNGLFDLDQPMVDAIVDTLPIGRAVDAACGTGRLTAPLVNRGHRVIGVDSSPDMLQHARRRLPNTDLVAGDLHHLPLFDDLVDLVVIGLALTHVADLTPVFVEFARVLRPGGDLVISDVHHDLVFLGSVVKAVGATGESQIATTHRHTTADFLRAGLVAGFSVRRYEEQPRPTTPEGAVPERTQDVGSWQDWPWTLMGLAPEASRAAWNNPAVIVWHFQLS
jgi:ubiquinone/menaquinone biosynthesis C-methylase UbiE